MNSSILKSIRQPSDLKNLSLEQLEVLAHEIRETIISVCAERGGHIAPSLGVVELTLALYRVFNADQDKIIWDVGHQTYAQKLITGRADRFHTLRTYQGISGFPKRHESKYDVFDTGHSSTSLSAATGFAIARDFDRQSYEIISVIGDGSLGAGMAFEALNHIGQLKKDIIVVLNDNERSIGETVGALSQYLTRVITTRSYNRFRDDLWLLLGRLPPYFRDRSRNLAKRIQEGLKGMYAPAVIFEELGFRYIGPLDGHKLGDLITTFSRVKQMRGPRIVHVVTIKGKGYSVAEQQPERFHGIGCFDRTDGKETPKPMSYTDFFGESLVRLARNDRRIIAITAGMCLGTGLKKFHEEFPDRFIDVGICEQHAVTMAAALALAGYRPVLAIYSTFLQRAYDQVIHDICLQNLPVVFAVDRAGLVGEDGPTHHGPFDLSYFGCLPDVVVSAPKDGTELYNLLATALAHRAGPFVIRYPRAAAPGAMPEKPAILPVGKWEVLHRGRGIVIIAIGSMVDSALQAMPLLERARLRPTLVNARYAKPLDTDFLDALARGRDRVYVLEENVLHGGLGSAVNDYLTRRNERARVRCIALPDRFIEHGARSILLKQVGLDPESVAAAIASAG